MVNNICEPRKCPQCGERAWTEYRCDQVGATHCRKHNERWSHQAYACQNCGFETTVIPWATTLKELYDLLRSEMSCCWVNVADASPPQEAHGWSVRVLTVIQHEQRTLKLNRISNGGHWEVDHYNVTHWTPLPELPAREI